MGCYFCYPADKCEDNLVETEAYAIIPQFVYTQNISQRLYTVKEEIHETSECLN